MELDPGRGRAQVARQCSRLNRAVGAAPALLAVAVAHGGPLQRRARRARAVAVAVMRAADGERPIERLLARGAAVARVARARAADAPPVVVAARDGARGGRGALGRGALGRALPQVDSQTGRVEQRAVQPAVAAAVAPAVAPAHVADARPVVAEGVAHLLPKGAAVAAREPAIGRALRVVGRAEGPVRLQPSEAKPRGSEH
eukprot:1432606-Prymnesium_polylepis.1